MATNHLEQKLTALPTLPGCYLHKDAAGKIIYIGKAKNLRQRVRQYFQQSRAHDAKTNELVARIRDFEYIITDTELEALILESNLIKEHRPRYNVLLKDDKQYPHLKLTLAEAYPRVLKTRRVISDGSYYYGPCLPASLAENTLKLINQFFQLRTCDITIDGKRDRPCLEYHIKRCLGPCVAGLCAPQEYDEAVRDVKLFLAGKNQDLLASLEARMYQAAEEMRFEQAAKYRDQLRVIHRLSEDQKMLLSNGADIDIFGYYQEGDRATLQLFTMRAGKIIGRREFFWEDLCPPFDPSQFLNQALKQYYALGNYIPEEIHVPVDFEDRAILAEFLQSRRGATVKILDPTQGLQPELLELVAKNAQHSFEQRFRVLKPEMSQVLQDLQDVLELPELPTRIESFDISHFQGAENVAAMVVCDNGRMNKREYRKFQIKSVVGADDFASMYEAVGRRYRRLLDEQQPLPSLVLIDGGKGQLAAAVRALSELGLETQPVAAIAKREEILFIKGRENEPLYLERHSPVLHLIQMIRDETHRFVVSYHRKRREMRDFTSELTTIPGIGPKWRMQLLRKLGSLRAVSQATRAELVPIVGEKRAAAILEYFRTAGATPNNS
jgi:excinuclease ABC subunit C